MAVQNAWDAGGELIIERFRVLHAENYSFAEIADQLSAEFNVPLSRNGAIGKAHRLGLVSTKQSGFSELNKQHRAKRIVRKARTHPRPPVVYQPKPEPATGTVPLHLNLIDLEQGQCCFPFGEGPFTFCGCPTVEGHSYCLPHGRICGDAYFAMPEAQRRSEAQKRRWAHQRAMRAA